MFPIYPTQLFIISLIEVDRTTLEFLRETYYTFSSELQSLLSNIMKICHNEYFQLLIIGLLLQILVLVNLQYKQNKYIKNDCQD